MVYLLLPWPPLPPPRCPVHDSLPSPPAPLPCVFLVMARMASRACAVRTRSPLSHSLLRTRFYGSHFPTQFSLFSKTPPSPLSGLMWIPVSQNSIKRRTYRRTEGLTCSWPGWAWGWRWAAKGLSPARQEEPELAGRGYSVADCLPERGVNGKLQ